MSASVTLIRDTALMVQRSSPRLAMGHHVSEQTRLYLETLAQLCGLSDSDAANANDADLISIYLVALKDPRGGERVAQRIAMRLDPLAGTPGAAATPSSPPRMPPLPEPFKATPPPLPEPFKATPPAAPGLTHDRVRGIVRDELGLCLEPLQVALNDLGREHTEALERVATEAQLSALETMREAMVVEAHAAAAIALKDMRPTLLDVIREPNAAPVALGLVHKKTPQIINALSAGVNVYLHGPAGSGKTTVAHKCAEAFGLEFRFAAKVESEYQLIGFKDAKGDTVRTQFRDAYEHGGVFLFDEMDASSPSAVVALNAALANGHCPFPDAIVKRHAQFYCIGAGNTKLTGANRQYAGRNQLDAASIDRFAFIEFDYDNELELALASDRAWAQHVQRVRQVVADRGLNHLVTPRATYDGCKLLAAGFDRDTVENMVIYKGLDADTVRQIQNAL